MTKFDPRQGNVRFWWIGTLTGGISIPPANYTNFLLIFIWLLALPTKIGEAWGDNKKQCTFSAFSEYWDVAKDNSTYSQVLEN